MRSDLKLDIFGEKLETLKDLVCSYIKAAILPGIQALQLYLNNELIETF